MPVPGQRRVRRPESRTGRIVDNIGTTILVVRTKHRTRMKINETKLQAILALPGPKRYSHFIKVAADQRQVWGLWNDGWALAATEDGTQVFPLWPAREYAERCAVDDWSSYGPREIDLERLFEDLLPDFAQSGMLVGVFPTPSAKGVTPDLNQLEADLRQELSRIE